MVKKLLPIVLLSGCAYHSETTAVTPVGNGTYAVSGRSGQYAGGAQGGQMMAMQKANAFCAADGGKAVVVRAIQPQAGGATVYFRCTPP